MIGFRRRKGVELGRHELGPAVTGIPSAPLAAALVGQDELRPVLPVIPARRPGTVDAGRAAPAPVPATAQPAPVLEAEGLPERPFSAEDEWSYLLAYKPPVPDLERPVPSALAQWSLSAAPETPAALMPAQHRPVTRPARQVADGAVPARSTPPASPVATSAPAAVPPAPPAPPVVEQYAPVAPPAEPLSLVAVPPVTPAASQSTPRTPPAPQVAEQYAPVAPPAEALPAVAVQPTPPAPPVTPPAPPVSEVPPTRQVEDRYAAQPAPDRYPAVVPAQQPVEAYPPVAPQQPADAFASVAPPSPPTTPTHPPAPPTVHAAPVGPPAEPWYSARPEVERDVAATPQTHAPAQPHRPQAFAPQPPASPPVLTLPVVERATPARYATAEPRPVTHLPTPPAAPVKHRPRVELGFADGSYEWLDPNSAIAQELAALASGLTTLS